MKSTHLTLMCLLFAGVMARAQDLHIYYDVYRDSVWYKCDGRSIARPQVRQGAQVHFHLVEYNRYVFQTGIETRQEDVSPGMSAAGAPFLLEAMAGMSPIGMGGITPSTPLNSNTGYPTLPVMPKAGAPRGAAAAVADNMERLHGLDLSIRQNALEIEELEAAFVEMETMGESLDAMLWNPLLPPSLVQQEAARYQRQFEQGPTDFRQSAGRHSRMVKAMKARRDSLSQVMEQLAGEQVLWAGSGEYMALLDESIAIAEDFDERLKEKSAAEWENLRLRLKEVTQMPFALHQEQIAERDQLTCEVEVTLQEAAAGRLGLEAGAPYRKRTIVVQAYGGFKVNASVGMAFGSFFRPQEKYFVRESQIESRREGMFVPALASFLHFYTVGKNNLSWGGSVGVGAQQGQSLAFFLGPSLLLGKRDRLVVTAGIMGARAERLDEGYAAGEGFDGDSGDLPLFQPYEAGVFVGMSFNLFGN